MKVGCILDCSIYFFTEVLTVPLAGSKCLLEFAYLRTMYSVIFESFSVKRGHLTSINLRQIASNSRSAPLKDFTIGNNLRSILLVETPVYSDSKPQYRDNHNDLVVAYCKFLVYVPLFLVCPSSFFNDKSGLIYLTKAFLWFV